VISKKIREFFVSLMEAQSEGSVILYNNELEQYSGVFNEAVINKFIDQGIIELVSNENDITTIIVNGREDFLSGFASGVNEAKLGRDQYYADYNANPFAFSIGFEHFHHYNKKKRKDPNYFCHGFIDESNDE